MARKSTALSYLPFTLTQGAADGYIQASIATALTGQTKTCYRMASLEIELPSQAISATADWQLQITRKSYAAMPTSPVVEKSMIWYFRRQHIVITAVGALQASRTLNFTWSDDDAPIIVEDPIYAAFDSATTSLTNVVYGRIGYWLDSISEVDKLTLVANSLS